MIFLNTNGHNNREGLNHQQDENTNRKTSSSRNSQPNLANRPLNKRHQRTIKQKSSCKETVAKVLAFIGVFGLLAGIGLLVFGVIEYINDNNPSKTVAIASIASASALILVSLISLIAVSWVLCFKKN